MIALRAVSISAYLAIGFAMPLCTPAMAEPFGIVWRYSEVYKGAYLAGIYNHQRKLEALDRRLAGDKAAISKDDFNATSVKFAIECDSSEFKFSITGNEYRVDELKRREGKIDIFENPISRPVSIIINGMPAINLQSTWGTILGFASREDRFGLVAQAFYFLEKSKELHPLESEIFVFTPDGLKIHKYDASFSADENHREILKFKSECRRVAGRWSD